jgi:RimJ/RimL family protein N-acetyltransferase
MSTQVESLNPILQAVCNEPDGTVLRKVYPLNFDWDTTIKFWEKAKKHRTLYGKEIPTIGDFLSLFFYWTENGRINSNGMFWQVDDMEGVFYLTDIGDFDALVHYSFFNGRHKGRLDLVKGMLKHIFDTYHFSRLTAEIPCYATPQAKNFCQSLGFTYEGKRRKSAMYKGEMFDTNLYGLLKEEFKYNQGD